MFAISRAREYSIHTCAMYSFLTQQYSCRMLDATKIKHSQLQTASIMPMLDFAVLAQDCAPWVAPQTLAAIVKTESSFNPYAIGVNGAKLSRQPANKDEAVVTAQWLIAQGYSVDLGLGQINSFNLRKYSYSVSDAFDVCKNMALSATILERDYQAAKKRGQGDQAALQTALSAYNTGSTKKGFTNGYVSRVLRNARKSP